MLSHVGQSAFGVLEEPVELLVHRGVVGLVVHAVQHRLHGRPHGLGAHRHEVRRVVGAAALPRGSRQVRRNRPDQPGGERGQSLDPVRRERLERAAAAQARVVGAVHELQQLLSLHAPSAQVLAASFKTPRQALEWIYRLKNMV